MTLKRDGKDKALKVVLAIIAMTLCFAGSSLLSSISFSAANHFSIEVAGYLPLCAVSGFCIFLTAQKIGRLSYHRWLMPLSIGGLLLGASLAGVSYSINSIHLFLSGMLILALFSTLSTLQWFEGLLSFSDIWTRRIVIISFSVSMLSGLSFFQFSEVSLYAGSACFVIACMISLFFTSIKEEERIIAYPPRKLSLRPGTVFGIVIIAIGAHLASLSSNENILPWYGILLAATSIAVLLWLFTVVWDSTNHISFLRCIITISIFVYALKGFHPQTDFTLTMLSLISGSIAWAGVFILALELCTYSETSHLRILSGAYVLLLSATSITSIASIIDPNFMDLLFSDAFRITMLLLLVVVGVWLLNERELDMTFWGRAEEDDATNIDITPQSILLAKTAGLTPREEEIFVLLAAGRSAPYIAEELFIETSTVKSHVIRIYRKLGIHTRQELISLVKNEPQKPRP